VPEHTITEKDDPRIKFLEDKLEDERSAREIITFLATSLAMPCGADADDVMTNTLEFIGYRAGVDRVFVSSINRNNAEKLFEWHSPSLVPKALHLEDKLVPFESMIFGPACSNSRSLLIDRYSTWDHLPPAYIEWFEKSGATSAMFSFYGSQSDSEGLIVFEKHGDNYEWTPARRELIQTIVNLLGSYHRRLRADTELRESEQFLKMAQAAAGLVCWEIKVGQYIRVFGNYFGTIQVTDRIYEITWADAFNIYVPPYDERVRAVVENAWRTGEPFVMEAMVKDGAGAEIWVEVRAQGKIGTENETRIYGITQDVDSRKRIERKLRDVNAKLDDMARRDVLTGLLNKREFTKDIQNLCTVFERIKRPLSMVMMDIDHFKLFNDSYGHLTGDDCLRQVGQTLAMSLMRDADSAYRYGGEEFALILPDTGAEGAMQVAEKMRMQIASLNIPHTKNTAADHVTASFGVATTSPDEAAKPNDLIARADAALYKAKKEGRNRAVAAASDETPAE
jgi:diguanylate cyclase (GGDEF)-like protein